MIGYAFTGSFCTLAQSLKALEQLILAGEDVLPIMSERVYGTDTRFFKAEEFKKRVRELTGKEIIHTVEGAEPFGAITPLDELIICPCTGNTLSKLSLGITDTAVTMAAKAHLRCDRPLLIALSTNDAMSQSLGSLSRLITRRSVYFVPMLQDSPKGKPYSLVADLSGLCECLSLMRSGTQKRPIFL